jgi:RNA polymerase sigma-70 factor (ECF subfamily)
MPRLPQMNDAESDQLDSRDMQRLVRGDEGALNELMQRHAERLFHYLIRQAGNETDAADLAQESFVRVYQSRDRFRADAKFSTWLYTIATNLLKNRYRWRSRHPETSMDAENGPGGSTLSETFEAKEPQPAEQLEREEQCKAVRHAVLQLPEKLRMPLILAEYEDKSMQEIAEILECSVKAVEGRLSRAREELRGRLEAVKEL